MDQNSKIQYYNNQFNSLFDENEDEIKDVINDYDLNRPFLKRSENELLYNIINYMVENFYPNIKNNKGYFSKNELNQITTIYADFHNHSCFENLFGKYENFDFIFKYLNNIQILNSFSFGNVFDTYIISYENIDELVYKTFKISLPDTIKEIRESAFSGSNISEIKLPNSITIIPNHCFNGCKLTSITLPDSIKIIEYSAFCDCHNLEKIVFNNSVNHIGVRAFLYCYNLKEIILPNSIKEIGENAFSYCTRLENIVIPKTIKTLMPNAFSSLNSNRLKEITIPGEFKNLMHAIFSNTDLSNVKITYI